MKNVELKKQVKKQFLSAFDLDHTLLNDNCSFRFAFFLFTQRQLSLIDLAFVLLCKTAYFFYLISLPDLHEIAFRRLFLARSQLNIKHYVEKFLNLYLKTMLYQPAIDKLHQAQQEGHLVVILSSSPDFLVESIAKRLGVHVWDSTKYIIDNQRCFSKISKLMLGSEKAEFIEMLQNNYGISRKKIAAYSDSYLDLPFLMAAGNAIGVNPDRKLKLICKKKYWPII